MNCPTYDKELYYFLFLVFIFSRQRLIHTLQIAIKEFKQQKILLLLFSEGETDPLQIAMKELKQQKIPIIVRQLQSRIQKKINCY